MLLPFALLATGWAAEEAAEDMGLRARCEDGAHPLREPEAPGKPHLTLRMFGTTAEGMILNVDSACEPVPGGDLKALSGDAEDESVRISGKPGAPILQVKADKLPRFDDRDKDVEVSGTTSSCRRARCSNVQEARSRQPTRNSQRTIRRSPPS